VLLVPFCFLDFENIKFKVFFFQLVPGCLTMDKVSERIKEVSETKRKASSGMKLIR